MDLHEKRVAQVEAYLDRMNPGQALLNDYRGRTILVTGGAGAVGANLTCALACLVGATGKVVVLDNLSSIKHPEAWNVVPQSNVLFVRGDVRSDVDLKRVFRENPSIVFHLAAFFANQNSVDYPETSADVDVMGHIRVLEYARMAGVDRLVFAGTGSALTPPTPDAPLTEDCVTMKLTTPYQVNKMAGEMYCHFYHHHYGMKNVICRLFNSYGPGEVPGQYRNVIPNFLYWALRGQGLPITGDGGETRDFTYVLDVVQGLLQAAHREAAVGLEFHLAAGREILIRDLAATINELTGNKAPIRFLPRRKWDTKARRLASNERARTILDFKPLVEFREGLLETISWFHDHRDTIERFADFTPGMSSAVREKPSGG